MMVFKGLYGAADEMDCTANPTDPVCSAFYANTPGAARAQAPSSTPPAGSSTGINCAPGYSPVSLNDGTTNCVKADAAAALLTAGENALTTALAPGQPWYKRPIVLLGIVGALAGGAWFVMRK